MVLVLEYLSYGCLVLGAFLGLTGAVGILRMPDFYTRLHPAGKADTMAQLLIVTGLVCQQFLPAEAGSALLKLDFASFQGAAKLLLISGFLFLTTPASTHAITRAAHIDGLDPWTKPGSKNAEVTE